VKSLRPTHPTVPVLALGKCDVARCWVYVKDDRPFGGSPSCAVSISPRELKHKIKKIHLSKSAQRKRLLARIDGALQELEIRSRR
jgi:hypothetical protein